MNRYKHILVILFFFFLPVIVFASAGKSIIDSLETQLKKTKDDTSRIVILFKLAEEYFQSNKIKSFDFNQEARSLSQKLKDKTKEVLILNQLTKFYISTDPEKGLEYAKQTMTLAKSNKNKEGEAENLKNFGRYYFKKNNLDLAIDYFKKALVISESIKNYKECGDLQFNIGYVYNRMGNTSVVVDYYLKALDAYIKINNYKEIANMYVKTGNVFLNKGDYETAINYYNKSLETSEKLKDTLRIGNSYQMMGIVYHEWGNYGKAIEYYKKSLEIFEKLRYKQGIANNFINIGSVYQSMNRSKSKGNQLTNQIKDKSWQYNNSKSLEYYSNAHTIMKELLDPRGIINTLKSIGETFEDATRYDTAIACYNTALDSARKIGDKAYIQELSKKIGYAYYWIKKYDLAEKYFNEALSKASEIDNKQNVSEILYKMGLLYTAKENYESAIKYLNQSYEILKKVKQKEQTRDVYIAFAEAYEKMGNSKMALENYKKYNALKDSMLNEQTLDLITNVEAKYQTDKKEQEIKFLNTDKALKENQIKQQKFILWFFVAGFLIIIIFSILLYRQFNEKKKANEILKKQQDEILQKNEELQQQKEEIMAQSELLEETNHELEKLSIVASKTDNAVVIASTKGDIEWVNDGFSRLFGYTLDEFIGLKGRNIIDVSTNSNIKEYLNQSINEKKSVVYTSRAIAKSGEEIWLQTTLTPIFDSGGNFFKIIAIDSDITKIKQAEQEVENQRDIALIQRDLISEQKQEITDSINYAQQIQAAVLPTIDFIGSKVSDFFVLFKPRDIVSGDFYWATSKENKLFIAVVDCTGHGVPGAFMSMLGVAFLNEIVNKTFDIRQDSITASEILEQLRDRVITSLHQTGKLGGSQDGMDMVMCILDMNKMTMQYSGANNPIYIVSGFKFEVLSSENNFKQETSNFKLVELKGDKMPIGFHYRTGAFSNHNINISKGDTLYIFSDGYADQFGGEKAKKFKYKPFQELLLSMQHHSMTVQKEIIEKNLNDWKGDIPQIDDIVVVGIRI